MVERLLIIDDDARLAAMVSDYLTAAGYDVDCRFTGREGLATLERESFDAIILDVMLPGRDGVDLTQSLKADPALAGIPVVMLTGDARREVLMRSMEAGAADFIVKPFTPDALLAKLAKYLPLMH